MKVYEAHLPNYSSLDDLLAQNAKEYAAIKEVFDKSPAIKAHAEHLFGLTQSDESLRANTDLIKKLILLATETVGVPLGEDADPRLQTAAIMACLVPMIAAVKIMTMALNGSVRESKVDMSTAFIARETADVVAENLSARVCALMDAVYDRLITKPTQPQGQA